MFVCVWGRVAAPAAISWDPHGGARTSRPPGAAVGGREGPGAMVAAGKEEEEVAAGVAAP